MLKPNQIKFKREILKSQEEYQLGNKKPLEELIKANTFKLIMLSIYNLLSPKPTSFF